MGGDEARMDGLLAISQPPHRLDAVPEITADLLRELLAWIDEERPN